MRLLLIEDEEQAAIMIAKALRQESHTVELALDGKAGRGESPLVSVRLDHSRRAIAR